MPAPPAAARDAADDAEHAADDEGEPDQQRQRLQAHVGQREDEPAEREVDHRRQQPDPSVLDVHEGADEVDDAGDHEPDPEHDQDGEQALPRSPHDDEPGHDPEQAEHGGEHAGGGVLAAAEGVDEAERAEQQQVDAGDERERQQRESGKTSASMPAIVPSTPATIRIVPNWRRSPRSSASTGVVVVMSLMLGPGGVSGSHTARVISTEPPGSRIASRTSGASSAACSANSRAGSPAGRWPMRR